MLYLAEVQKQSKGVFGGSETKLLLLACQRNDQTWSAIPKGETIVTEDASSFNDGALVMINLSETRQIQGKPEGAGGQLARILQRFSGEVEKAKKAEEEIETWRGSLEAQGRMLNERQDELDARLDELEHKEQEFKELEAKRQEVEALQAQAHHIKQEFEQKSKELEGAWEHLRGEQKRLEEKSDEIKASGSVLDQATSQKLQELLTRLSSSKMPSNGLSAKLKQALEIIGSQQVILQKEWEQLESQVHQVDQTQGDLDRREQDLHNRKQELKDSVISIETAKTQLQIQEKVLASKQEALRLLEMDIAAKEELQDLLCQVASGGGDFSGESKIDIGALENMPLSELEGIVNNLRSDLDRLVRFLNDQEEELNFKKQTIEELEQKVNSVSESEKINLEGELEDEREGYKLLNESIVGSRRSILEKESIFKQHLLMLRRRQGIVDIEGDTGVNLDPVLERLNEQRQQQEEEKAKLEDQITQINQSIQQVQNIIQQQQAQQGNQEEQIRLEDEQLLKDRVALIKLQEQLKIYAETINPLNQALIDTQENIKEFEQICGQMEEINHQQNDSLAEIEEMLRPIL